MSLSPYLSYLKFIETTHHCACQCLNLESTYLIIGTSEGFLFKINLIKNEIESQHPTDLVSISSLVMFNYNKFYACGTLGGINLYSFQTMEIISKLTGHNDKVNCIVLNKTKSHLFSSSNDKSIIQWDLVKSSHKVLYEHISSSCSLAICNKSSYIASSCKDNEIIVYNIEPNQEDKIIINTKQRVLCLVFTPNCGYLICGDLEKNVSIFKYKTWEKVREFKGHENRIVCMSVSNNSRVLVTCSYDQSIKIWDLLGVEDDWEAKELYMLEGHGGWVNGVVFSRDNRVIYSVCEERKVGIWGLENLPVCGGEDGVKKGKFMCAGVAAAVFAGVLVYKVMRKKK